MEFGRQFKRNYRFREIKLKYLLICWLFLTSQVFSASEIDTVDHFELKLHEVGKRGKNANIQCLAFCWLFLHVDMAIDRFTTEKIGFITRSCTNEHHNWLLFRSWNQNSNWIPGGVRCGDVYHRLIHSTQYRDNYRFDAACQCFMRTKFHRR